MKRVLVVGGYGAVGADVCKMLSTDPRVRVVVAGRSAEKAGQLAASIGGEARAVDAHAPGDALADIDAVINCFIDLGAPNVALAEAALSRGLLYLDVAGVPLAHCDAVLSLHDRAVAKGATLVTALGCNPGIPALLALSCEGLFDRVDSVDFYFALGSKLTGLSLLSMQGVGQLMAIAPAQFRDGAWREPDEGSKKRLVGPPFSREVYFGPSMISRDLLGVPARLGASKLTFWSGIEDALQGLVFISGVKLGGTAKPNRAARLLRVLRALSSSESHDEAVLEMEVRGSLRGAEATRHVAMAASEELFTAIAPALVLQQWLDGEVTRAGAFVAPDVVPARSFVARLARAPVAMRDELS